MRPLYLQNLTGGDRHLSGTGAGRTDPRFEGHAFLARPTFTTQGVPIEDLQALTLCKQGIDLDVVVGPPPAGCADPQSLSFALPPP
jgi:hypothetical protein